ncbi:MAG: hypothetical protein ACE5HX_03215 [bacterium]
MRSKTLLLLLVGFLVNLSAFPVIAQNEEPKGQLWSIYQESVKPDMAKDYEALTREWIAQLTELKMTSPYFNFTTIQGEDFTYSFAIQIENFAALDGMQKAWMEFEQKIDKEKFQEMMQRGSACTQSINQWLAMEMPNISYAPATPRLKPEEIQFYHYDFFYVKPGKNMEFHEISKQWLELYKSKSATEGWTMYQAMMVPDQPLYIVASGAKNAVDFYTALDKTNELLGKENVDSLWSKTMALVRKFEHKNSTIRPDLSYHSEPEMTAK